MRPTRLRLNNFGCYRGQVEIDFSEISSDLFAIAGPIGSGKSTLLDAMTWALYGRTPRLGGKPNEHLFTPGEEDLAVVLEFESTGVAYRATRALRKKKSGISPSVKLERQEGEKWLALRETEKVKEYEAALEKIVGLDYDGYVRAVMLPQGAFDEFLRGDPGKRQELFKALLKAYTIERMRDLAVSERGEVKTKLDQARARLENEYKGVTREREAALVEDLTEHGRILEGIKEKVGEFDRQVKDHEALGKLDSQMREAKTALERLALEASGVQQAREDFERGQAAAGLRAVIKAYRDREADVRKASEAVGSWRGKVSEAEGRREEAKRAHEAALGERDEKQEPLRKRLIRLEGARRDASLLKRHGADVRLASRSDGDAFDEEALERVSNLLAHLDTLRHLEKSAASSEATLGRKHEELERQRAALVKSREDLERQKDAGAELRKAANEAEKDLERALVENQALALREHLHEGDACPVCENVVQQVPPTEDGVVDLKGLREAAKQANERLQEAITGYKSSQKELGLIEKAAGALEREIEKVLAPAAKEARTERDEALKRFEGVGRTAEEIGAALQAERDRQLARLAARVHEITGGQDFETLETETQRAIKALDDAVEKAEKRFNAAESTLVGVRAKLESAEGHETTAREALASAKADMDEALGESRFDGLEAVEAAILEPAEMQRLQRLVEEHAKKRAQADAKKNAAEAVIAGRTYDREAHEQAARLLAEQKRLEGEKQQELGGKERELKALRERLTAMEGLERERAELEQQHGVLHNLALSLQSNRFEAYVLGHAQADLAMTASEIIHDVTDGRYELTYRDKEFFVRDTWMDAHERSVKTLSGGESFIVSLALALALSDTIAGRHSLGALFLDEGFGTLDAATLDSVTEVLSNLTSNGRMVGVITHVTSLTDRLPARLMISKSQGGSSAAWDA